MSVLQKLARLKARLPLGYPAVHRWIALIGIAVSPCHAAVRMVLPTSGTSASATDLVLANLAGPVTVESTNTGLDPSVSAPENILTSAIGVAGAIKISVHAADIHTGPFDPDTWSGGGQGPGNAISIEQAGWGVRADARINGSIEAGEALLLAFDLSGLTLGAGQSVVVSSFGFVDSAGNPTGSVWKRATAIPLGTGGAGFSLASSARKFDKPFTIQNGDVMAVLRGNVDTRLQSITIDILATPAQPSMEVLPDFSEPREDTAKSLQGLRNRNPQSLIWLEQGQAPHWPSIYATKYGYQVSYAPETDTTAGLMSILNRYSNLFDGYILYDRDATTSPVSKFVALSLAGIRNAIVIDKTIEADFIAQIGKPMIADVRTRDAAWLWANYGGEFEKNGMCLPNTYDRTFSADFAVMNRWPIIPSDNQTTIEAFLGSLLPNATITGWVPMYLSGGEDAMVTYFSDFDVKLLPGVNTFHNFSAITGVHDYSSGVKKAITFSQNPAPTTYPFNPAKHYVALFTNSGDNLNYVNRRFLADTGNTLDGDNWMNVPHTVPMTISIAPWATELSPAAMREIYDRQYPQDRFATPYSGHAYIHPSRFPSLDEFASELVGWLERSDQTSVAIQEAENNVNDSWVTNYGAKLLNPSRVTGIYSQRGPFGRIFAGPGNKPVVNRRVVMNINDSSSAMTSFINMVNAYPVSPTTENGYSVIQVNLESTNIQDCQELYDNRASHIEFVTLDELFYHVKTQVIDSDHDGMADAWERSQFGNLDAADELSNWDGDPSSDLDEFIAATNPKDADSYFKVFDFAAGGSGGRVIGWPTVLGRTYSIEHSMDLTPGRWKRIVSGIKGVNGRVEWTDTDPTRLAGSRGFYRVVAVWGEPAPVERPDKPLD